MGTVLQLLGGKSLRRLAGVLLALSLGAFGTLGASIVALNHTTHDHIYHGLDEVPVRDVAIVPGIGTRSHRIPPCLHERLAPALALYRTHKVRAILVSGIGATPERDEVTTMVDWLVERGVRREDIRSDPAGYRTLDTMQRAAKILGVGSAIVVTQGLYMPRAVFLARSAGIDAVGFVAPSTIPMAFYRIRQEALKVGLAVADIHLLGRGPRYTDAHGARLSQRDPEPPALAAQPAAFSFFTSAISAGMAASQVATSP